MSIVTIQPRQLDELRAAGKPIHLIDVRTAVEYREVHVEFARNVPLDQLDPQALAGTHRGAEPLYVICHSGSRGRKACDMLRAAGIVNVINVEGGTVAWASSGLPVVRGKKSLSVERQTRITIGMLVLVGVALGWLVHPALLGLAALMGAGLVYAGVCDSCPLALCVARMPWNRVSAEPCCGSTAAATTH